MASLWKRGEHFSLRIVLPNGERKSIALFTTDVRRAERIQERVERLVAALKLGEQRHPDDALWLAKRKPAVRGALEKLGIVKPAPGSVGQPRTIAELVEQYIAIRSDVKVGTSYIYEQVKRNLAAFFGDKSLDAITSGDADEGRVVIRQIDDVQLIDCSVVTHPAYKSTSVALA